MAAPCSYQCHIYFKTSTIVYHAGARAFSSYNLPRHNLNPCLKHDISHCQDLEVFTILKYREYNAGAETSSEKNIRVKLHEEIHKIPITLLTVINTAISIVCPNSENRNYCVLKYYMHT